MTTSERSFFFEFANLSNCDERENFAKFPVAEKIADKKTWSILISQ